MEKNKRVRLEIYGRVQGVFFRASTREEGRRLGVFGWVRNRRDGSVEAVVEGAEKSVDQLVEWAQNGPTRASVERLEVSEEQYLGEFDDFRVRR